MPVFSMITREHRMEGLSRAYVRAVTARAGFNIWLLGDHDYGIDGTIRRVEQIGDKLVETGASLDFQLKSTTKWLLDGDLVKYDMEAKDYNALVSRGASSPALLILLCLPQREEEWISLSEEELIMRKCCYYTLLSGEPTPNKESVRVKLPTANRLTPDALGGLLSGGAQ